MSNAERQTESRVTVDVYTRCCLTVIAVLLTLVTIALWSGTPPMVAPAAGAPGEPGISSYDKPEAQLAVHDPAAQRNAQVLEQKVTNAKLDEILKALTGGKVKVVVVQTEDKSEGTGDALPPKTK